MPKEPETFDWMSITVKVDVPASGPVIAALMKMVGPENVRCELVTDVLRFKARSEGSAAAFAAEYVKANPRFASVELVAHFAAAGRTASGAYFAIKKLTEANIIQKSGNEYVRVEALPTPETEAVKPGKTRPPNPIHRYELKNKDLIAEVINGRKQFTMAELKAAFAKEGRNDKSISPILTGLVQSKRIKIVSPGHYAVLAKGVKPPKPAKKAAPKKLTPAQKRERDRLRHQASRDAAKKKVAIPAAQEGALIAMMNGTGGETTNG